MRAHLSLVVVALLAACAPMPPGPQDGAHWRASPNFDQRRPNYIILHQTTNATVDQALATLTDPRRKVSSHYLVARDGEIIQLVDEASRAWHAGESWWGGTTDLNSASIGIELDNTGAEPFAAAQIDALLGLLARLSARYRIPAANVLAHGDIAPGRKVDPSHWFPWRQLAHSGFGLWCEPPWPPAPVGFDALLGLSALGYAVGVPQAARAAFRRHFLGREDDSLLRADELALLHCLVQQKVSPAGTAPAAD